MLIRFRYYLDEAPQSCAAFNATLPFTRSFFHARVSGSEIWIADAPAFHTIQENATVFTEPGEAVLAPPGPKRLKTAGCLGIYYGEGRGLDAANVFARVYKEDFALLENLGKDIWTTGVQELTFSGLD